MGQEFEIKLSDASEMEFYGFENFLSYCQSNSRKLVELNVSTRISSPVRCSFRIGSEYDFYRSDFTIYGPEKEARHIAEKLEDMFQSLRQWYSLLSRINSFAVSLVIFALFMFVLLYLKVSTPDSDKESVDITQFVVNIGLSFGILSIPAILGWVWKIFRNYFFPKTVFLFNDNRGMFDRMVQIRRFLVSALALSVAGYIYSLVRGLL